MVRDRDAEIEEKVFAAEVEVAAQKGEKAPVQQDKTFDAETEFYKGKDLLTDIEIYLKSGVHLGTKFKSGDMRKYIFKKRRDGLMVFNIETIDKRIRLVAKMLAKYEGKDIAVVCRRLYGHQPVKKFAALTGARVYYGRFIPGAFTNPVARNFYEPKVVLISDPLTDFQALKEASQSRIPVISVVGSESLLAKVDFAIPANNKGRKALALIFYLLARETLVERKEISREGFSAKPEDFEQEIDESMLEERPKRRFGAGGRGAKGGRGFGKGGDRKRPSSSRSSSSGPRRRS